MLCHRISHSSEYCCSARVRSGHQTSEIFQQTWWIRPPQATTGCKLIIPLLDTWASQYKINTSWFWLNIYDFWITFSKLLKEFHILHFDQKSHAILPSSAGQVAKHLDVWPPDHESHCHLRGGTTGSRGQRRLALKLCWVPRTIEALCWLVVWSMTCIFPCLRNNHHPNWLHIDFSEG